MRKEAVGKRQQQRVEKNVLASRRHLQQRVGDRKSSSRPVQPKKQSSHELSQRKDGTQATARQVMRRARDHSLPRTGLVHRPVRSWSEIKDWMLQRQRTPW